VVGGIQLIVGTMLWAGARWAFRAVQVLVPANFAASVVLYAVHPAASLLLVVAVFGFATYVLYGPGRFATASRTRIRVWMGGPAERRPATDRASPVVPHEIAA
jgi:hypothetical protein